MWMGSAKDVHGHVRIVLQPAQFVSGSKLGTNPMDLGLMRLSLCRHQLVKAWDLSHRRFPGFF